MTETNTPDEHDPGAGLEKAKVNEAGDTESDPGLGAGDSTDWASEGGAVPDGPATDPEAD